MVVTLTTRDPSALVVLSMFLFGSLNVAAAVAGTAVAIGGADGYPPTTMSGSSFNNTIVFVVIALEREALLTKVHGTTQESALCRWSLVQLCMWTRGKCT